jgi:hypothetical protein
MKKALVVLVFLTVVFMFYTTANGEDLSSVSGIPTSQTHVGQPPGRLIVLKWETGRPGNSLELVKSDGTHVPDFNVPIGQKLIITDVNWYYAHVHKGEYISLMLYVQNRSVPTRKELVYESQALRYDRGGGVAGGGANESMTTGFAVSSQGKIEVGIAAPSGEQPHTIVILRGYLIPDN